LPSSCNSTSCPVQHPHKGICPSGWHLPRDAEWTTLRNYVGNGAGTKLKATSGWNDYGTFNGTDNYGFSALPGGYSDGSFSHVGYDGYWWSATENSSSYAYGRYIYYSYDSAYWGRYGKDVLFSVRCLQDYGEAHR